MFLSSPGIPSPTSPVVAASSSLKPSGGLEMATAASTEEAGDERSPKHRRLSAESRAEGEEGCNLDPESFARSYQLDALEMARRQNTIVFLETGSGKTLIAVMLLRSYAHLIRKPSDSIAVFLVPTVVLVSQQADVLKMHTDLKVGKFWGDMGVDTWDVDIWNDKLSQYEVFVMTPRVLLNNLCHSFFNFDKIKLLIFDECHHAKGRSDYATIMKDFYHPKLKSDSVELPRIFGMTASLINSKGSTSRLVYDKQIHELESLMNSKVFTVANQSVLSRYIPFSTPKINFYEHMEMPSSLLSVPDRLKLLKLEHSQGLQELKLSSLVEESARKKLLKLHDTFLFCLTELGVWLAVQAAESLSCKENCNLFWGQSNDGACRKFARKFSHDAFLLFSQYLPTDRRIGDDKNADKEYGILSTKVLCLIKSLVDYSGVSDLRCIIFVERVITSIVLRSLLCKVKEISQWNVEYMAGSQTSLKCQTKNEQIKIVDAFREGKVNIIVATQILEEGLDVQSCNLVIRFDLSANVCSFIQSRGRARMQGSEYLLIIRSGDSSAIAKIQNYLISGDVMREESHKLASLPCTPFETEMRDGEFYRVKTTEAIVTLSSSVPLLYFYCSRLPSDGYFKPFPRFLLERDSSICTLHLPKSCPFQIVRVEGEKDMLKQIACLEACRKLHEIGALNDHLLPVCDMEIEDKALDIGGESYKTEQVDYFPGELVDSWSSFLSLALYHCYKITFHQKFSYKMSFSELALVVKSNLGSDFATNSFNLESDKGSLAVDIKYVGVVFLSREQVLVARRFQTSVLSILIHCDFIKYMDALNCLDKEHSSTLAIYLLLPLTGGKVDWFLAKSATFHMDNKRVEDSTHNCSSNGVARMISTKNGAVCSCVLKESVVYTPHNGRFYCITGIYDDLDGNSVLNKRGGKVQTYKEYFEIKHGISLTCESESLLSGRHLFQVQNFLLRRSSKKEKESSGAGVELPPELCLVIMSPITIGVLYSFSFGPSIMHRIQCLLLASRLKKNFLDHCRQDIHVPAIKLLEAITTKKCQEEFSLESLETLGDSFIKYATSQHVYSTYKHYHEGLLSAKKDRMISNAALYLLASKHNLAGFIRNEEFDPKQWCLPGASLNYTADLKALPSYDCVYVRGRRFMKGKVVADSVEALIGAYLSSAGELATFHFVRWLGMEINFCKDTIIGISTITRPETHVNVKYLESLLNYSFRNPSLLVEAMTHGSYQVTDIPRCYQRLEFLGDAILDHLITVHLYNKYPGLTPGLLTDLRSASVNNDCYAHAAAKAGLNKHILHASSELHKQMTYYINNFVQPFVGSSYGWEAGTALPKVLGDVIESLAGAIYVDSGYNKEIVWKSIRPLLEPLVTPETIEYHPVRELEELCSRKSLEKKYTKTSKDDVACIEVVVQGNGFTHTATRTGPNRETAKKLAARAVLELLKGSNISL